MAQAGDLIGMMGVKDFQGKLLYGFSLEEKVPADHLLRIISSTVDFGFIRRLARPFYSHTGAPSVDPVVVFKMSLIGYLYAITSERRLAEECRLKMAFLWFLGYDLDETPPDHSILSKARARFGRKVHEEFFAEIVRQCKEKGLVESDQAFPRFHAPQGERLAGLAREQVAVLDPEKA
ncbi:MAG: transposase [Firmicutes bacterium]|nr:transposase [Bacillota bacterium]